jgi:hypothetical protein
LVKLENSNLFTSEELERLRGSVMRLVAEIAVLNESQDKPEAEPNPSRPHAA